MERLGEEGAIPAPSLNVNRRQTDETEQKALATYRAGLVEESQELRADAGLQHELGSPRATKAAMADAVVADIDELGPHAVVALCATHADAEELADRVRARLAEKGVIGGPTLTGPGWASARDYAEGDRVLLHASFRHGADRLHNNTMATVIDVSADGLVVRTDDGQATVLDPAYVAGVRHDGRPNLSHGWVRTVEGSQGGTWEQVHLLGDAALDRNTGYVGQSRGQLPTHTWNARREHEADHGGRRVQAPSAADEVRTALERDEPQAFAASEDPYVVDRQLHAERAEHERILARRPPSVARDLCRARADAQELRDRHDGARARLESASESLAKAKRLRHLATGSGRRARVGAEYEQWLARQAVPRTRHHLAEGRAEVRRLEAANQLRDAFDQRESWRQDRLVEIEDRRKHHWAGAVLSAVREGHPLAYGPERLRQAHATFTADLGRVEHDKGHTQSRDGRQHGDALSPSEDRATDERAELSAIVGEIEEAIERHAPNLVQPGLVAESTRDPSSELKQRSYIVPGLDNGHDLGLGR
jgi:hypothetical protein